MGTPPGPPQWFNVVLSEPSIKILDDLPKGVQLFGAETRTGLGAVYGRGFAAARLRAMELITILNRCHRFRGFVYQQAHFSADKKCIEVAVRPRKGSAAVCSRCHFPAPGYDQLAERRFEFIPLWGFSSSFCTPCGASTVAAVALWLSKKFRGATANVH